MSYYIDLSGTGTNSYRVLRPNAILGVNNGVTPGTNNINVGGGVGSIDDDFGATNAGVLLDASNFGGDPETDTPITAATGGTSFRLPQMNLDTVTNFNNNGANDFLEYSGNGSALAELWLGFESLVETTVPGPGIADTSANNTSILRFAYDIVDRNGLDQTRTQANTVDIEARIYSNGTLIAGPLGPYSYNPPITNNPIGASSNNTLGNGRLALLVDVEFTIPPVSFAGLGSRRIQNLEVLLTQTNGSGGAQQNRAFPRFWAVELYANTLLINPYEPQQRAYFL